jgi:hypothetical protein
VGFLDAFSPRLASGIYPCSQNLDHQDNYFRRGGKEGVPRLDEREPSNRQPFCLLCALILKRLSAQKISFSLFTIRSAANFLKCLVHIRCEGSLVIGRYKILHVGNCGSGIGKSGSSDGIHLNGQSHGVGLAFVQLRQRAV